MWDRASRGGFKVGYKMGILSPSCRYTKPDWIQYTALSGGYSNRRNP